MPEQTDRNREPAADAAESVHLLKKHSPRASLRAMTLCPLARSLAGRADAARSCDGRVRPAVDRMPRQSLSDCGSADRAGRKHPVRLRAISGRGAGASRRVTASRSRALGLFHRTLSCVASVPYGISISNAPFRDGTLVVCLSPACSSSPVPQGHLASHRAGIPASFFWAARADAAGTHAQAMREAGKRRSWTIKMLRHSIPARGDTVPALPMVTVTAVGCRRHAANPDSRAHGAGQHQRAFAFDAVAFRVDSTVSVSPPWLPIGAAVLTDSTDANGPARRVATGSSCDRRPPVFYAVTLEPHWKHWLSRSTCPEVFRNYGDDTQACTPTEPSARYSISFQPPHHQPLRLAVLGLATLLAWRGARRPRTQGQPRVTFERSRSNPRLSHSPRAPQHDPNDAAFKRGRARLVQPRTVLRSLAPPLLGANAVEGSCRVAPRFLRTLCKAFVGCCARRVPRAWSPAPWRHVNPAEQNVFAIGRAAWEEAMAVTMRRLDPTSAVAPSASSSPSAVHFRGEPFRSRGLEDFLNRCSFRGLINTIGAARDDSTSTAGALCAKEAQRSRAVADHRHRCGDWRHLDRPVARWSWRRAGRIVRVRCVYQSFARAFPGRLPLQRTKDARHARARRAWPQFRKLSASSESYASGYGRRGDADNARARRRSGGGRAVASCLRLHVRRATAATVLVLPLSKASRSRPLRFKRCRLFSIPRLDLRTPSRE